MNTCIWTKKVFGLIPRGEYYDTSCNYTHEFLEGTPKENNYKFCPYCEKLIITKEDEHENTIH